MFYRMAFVKSTSVVVPLVMYRLCNYVSRYVNEIIIGIKIVDLVYSGLSPSGKPLVLETKLRGTQREYSSKPLKHSIVKRILVFKR